MSLLQEALEAKKLKVYCVVNHYSDMAEYGATPFRAYTVLFGSPALSSLFLAKNAELSLDMPLRIAVVSAGDKTRIVFRDAHYIFVDFQVVNPEELTNMINRIVEDIMHYVETRV